MKLLDTPFIKCFVDNRFISNNDGFEECYIFSVTAIASRPLLFNVHLASGAVFSRLPIHALSTTGARHNMGLDMLNPWTCVGHKGDLIEHEYLKDYFVWAKIDHKDYPAIYLFTVDYSDGNFSEDPEQHKTHNVLALDNGAIAALPNNMCLFKDKHFTTPTPRWPIYSRQTTKWRTS